jgi:hypothetical protein
VAQVVVDYNKSWLIDVCVGFLVVLMIKAFV